MSRLLEIRDYATALRTFEWKAPWEGMVVSDISRTDPLASASHEKLIPWRIQL